jgi:hypothetical protein
VTQPTGLPRTVYAILISWGLAVLLLAGLFAFWIDQTNDRARERDAEIQRQQNTAMCQIVSVIVSGPAPPAGPDGERGRAVVAGSRAFYQSARCAELLASAGP